jgi:hypothetical protein
VITLINAWIENAIRVVTLKQNLDIRQYDMNYKIIITLFSLFGLRTQCDKQAKPVSSCKVKVLT